MSLRIKSRQRPPLPIPDMVLNKPHPTCAILQETACCESGKEVIECSGYLVCRTPHPGRDAHNEFFAGG